MRATRDEIARLRRVEADATDKIGHCFEVLAQAGFSLKSRRTLKCRSTVLCLGTTLWCVASRSPRSLELSRD